jgi:hypothetical protein
VLNEVKLPDQTIAASRAPGVPPLAEPDLNFLQDQPLLGLSGLASEVQDKKPGPVRLDRAQSEIDPFLGDKASGTPPLKRPTGPVETEDILPFRI